MFEPGRNQLVAEPRIRRASVAIDRKRDDCQLAVRLAELRLQEIPIGAFPVVRNRDHDALDAREFLLIGRPDQHAAVRPRAKQPAIVHDRVDVRAPATLKRADGPRFRVAARNELKRDRAH